MVNKRNNCLRRAEAPRLRRFVSSLLLSALVVFLIVYWLDLQIRPMFLRIVEFECRQFAFNTFSDVADEYTELVPELYHSPYLYEYDPEGKIVAVTVDAYAINRIQAALSNEVSARLLQVAQKPLEIPIGTLTGIQALIGRGPTLKMHILPRSYVDADVYNTIESAGINKTKMNLYVRFTMSLGVAVAGYGTTVEVVDEQYMGEVLIIGDTPDTYLGSGQ